MKEIKNILNKYFDEETINIVLKKLEIKQRATAINENYFTKVGLNTNKLLFDNLVTEINLYNNNIDNPNLPSIVESYVDNDICIMVLKTITAKTIGKSRNKFNLHLTEEKRNLIISNVLKIKDINVKGTLDSTYNRKERLDKYLKTLKLYISKKAINIIVSKYDYIIKEKYPRAIAHGDLICTNIMLKRSKVYFIDWEFVSLKPMYYDLTYFLLFSKTHNSLEILKNNELYKKSIDIDELYKDAIILCLKEINNNAKLIGKLDDKIVNNNIKRWKNELNYIIKLF